MLPTIATGNVGSALAGEYEVANSLRFDDGSSDYLSRTPSSATNQKTFTFSSWCKLSATGENYLISSNNGGSGAEFKISFNANGTFNVNKWDGSSNELNLTTNALYRDFSAWYHVVVAVDTTNATADDRIKIYINGTQETSFSSRTNPSLNLDTGLNNTVSHAIGRSESNASRYYNGYMAEVVLIDGQALDPTSFGEFDEDSSIWKPINVSGLTFGTNGFYLDFENSGSLGADVSGNGNNFTVNNLTSIDQTSDSCTNNFATWNPLWSQSNGNIGDVTFSEGNLKSDTYVDYRTFPATMGFNSGKWYWEIKRYEDDGSADMHTGVMSELATPSQTATWIGNQANGWVFASDVGSTYTGGTETNTGYSSAGSAGDIVQVAFDADNGKIYFGVNGTWQNSGNPATGTNPAYTGLDTSLFYFPCTSTGSDVEANFGNPPYTISSGNSDGNGYGNFEYSVPSGYYALNSKNLAEYG